MLYVLTWSFTFILLSLWSLICWGTYGVAAWLIANAGNWAGGSAVREAVLLPAWLEPWVPVELQGLIQAILTSAVPLVQAMLETVPALAGAAAVLAWGLWGLGAVTLVGAAIGVHVLIAVFKRKRGPAAVSRG